MLVLNFVLKTYYRFFKKKNYGENIDFPIENDNKFAVIVDFFIFSWQPIVRFLLTYDAVVTFRRFCN